MSNIKIRVLLAKAGLEGHDPALIAMAQALKAGGMEVIYLGIHQTVESVVRAALEEGVDAVVLTVSPGAHRRIFPTVARELREAGRNVLVTGAAEIVQSEKEYLEAEGVGKIFDPAFSGSAIVEYLQSWYVQKKEARQAHFKKPLAKGLLRCASPPPAHIRAGAATDTPGKPGVSSAVKA